MTREERIRREQGERLRHARISAGYTSARSAALENGWPESSYRAHEGGTRKIGDDDADRYAARFRHNGVQITAREILFGMDSAPPSVPIVGLAGAAIDGSVLYPVDNDDLGSAPVPPGSTDDTVALEVRGTALHGTADDGWLIYYDDRRSPIGVDMVGELCVIGLKDGRTVVKTPHARTDGLYDLEGAAAPTMRAQAVEWAAPVIAIIPRGAARRAMRSAQAAGASARRG